ncbi:peptidase M18 aminopeptidase I [Thermincola ferriacetica]|uniref:M18 family aminopeptidase n=1 Tax=Thermincola ferriacetica TaxID=281456 RepID=A0A0L6W2B6_9FIRM|nr:aminopeptidase [Thermincola ferriacetica]KNZ69722.1 peptidase M18 aminopeptidase I [Thermincola ferriacetica]
MNKKEETKSPGEKLKEELCAETQLVWDSIDKKEKEEVMRFNEDYKTFLSNAKTEKQTVKEIIQQARDKGFISLEEMFKGGKKLKPGNKIFINYKNKSAVLVVVGKEPLWEGLNIVGSHVDAPRLDLKPQPLYEDQNLALMKTHYYGGIKKYQWPAIPLALHGVVYTARGTVAELMVGEKAEEPVFTISDLLPHLAKEQMGKKMGEAIKGEDLNILVGSIPVEDKEVKERVKLTVLKLLNERYGITEEDFISAELELVPAGPARDVGLDRSMVGGYGQDDRVCAYASLRAILDVQSPIYTSVAIFVDKEEIGSTGNTGMKSRFFENAVAEMLYLVAGDYNELYCRRTLAHSRALSADVSAGMDPNYPNVVDKYNAARLGYGVVITKYTGSGGKYSTSDANPGFINQVRRIFKENKVIWQTGELGKVDQGGGGTIAQYIARYGMEVLDCGVALLGMHSPFEVAHKGDIYMGYKAYKAFFEQAGNEKY